MFTTDRSQTPQCKQHGAVTSLCSEMPVYFSNYFHKTNRETSEENVLAILYIS